MTTLTSQQGLLTGSLLLHVVQHEVEQLIKPFQDADNFGECQSVCDMGARVRTFPAPSKFDPDFLVCVLGEIEDGLALGLVASARTPGATANGACAGASAPHAWTCAPLSTASCTATLDDELSRRPHMLVEYAPCLPL